MKFLCLWISMLLLISEASVVAFSVHRPSSHRSPFEHISRRDTITIKSILITSPITLGMSYFTAYTPDSDALRESLYLICRVQEATCLHERYIQKKAPPIQKMKLTLETYRQKLSSPGSDQLHFEIVFLLAILSLLSGWKPKRPIPYKMPLTLSINMTRAARV